MVGEVKWIQKMQGGRANDATEVTNATEGGREGGREQAEDGAREMIMPEKMLPPPPPPSPHSMRTCNRAVLATPSNGVAWQAGGGLLNKEGERE